MCEPTAIFAASQAVGLGGQAIAANQQNKFNKAVSKQNEAAIRDGLNTNLGLLGQQSIQERQAAAARLEGIRRQARNAEGTALASAGANGVSGQSLSFLADTYEQALAESATNVDITLRNSEAQRAAQAQNLVTQARQGLIANLPQQNQGPGFIDLLTAGLNVAAFKVEQDSEDEK